MIEEITNLYHRGVSYRSIARRLGISPGKVAGIIHRLGIAHRDQPQSLNASKTHRASIPIIYPPIPKAQPFNQPPPSPYLTTRHRIAYEDLRKAVENTK